MVTLLARLRTGCRNIGEWSLAWVIGVYVFVAVLAAPVALRMDAAAAQEPAGATVTVPNLSWYDVHLREVRVGEARCVVATRGEQAVALDCEWP